MLREGLESRLDRQFLDRLLSELPYGLSLGLGHELAYQMFRARSEPPAAPPNPQPDIDAAAALASTEQVTITVGRALLTLVAPQREAPLLKRVTKVREHLARELGIVIPGVYFRDDLTMGVNVYQIFVRGGLVARGALWPDRLLSIGPEQKVRRLAPDVVRDPVWGMPGVWIAPEQKLDAEGLGLVVFDAVAVISAHLTEVLLERAHELQGLQETQKLLDLTAQSHPAAVREVLARLGLPELTGVLQNLLRERIPIRDLPRILEVLARQAIRTQHADRLSEKVRAALGRIVCQRLADAQGTLHLIELAPELDEELAQAYRLDEVDCSLELTRPRARAILDWVKAVHAEVWDDRCAPAGPVVLVASPEARPALARLVHGHFAHVVVLSWAEIPPGTELVVTSTAA